MYDIISSLGQLTRISNNLSKDKFVKSFNALITYENKNVFNICGLYLCAGNDLNDK